ncbi:MAG TPA: orotidine-5'-phosphate decarboxylase [Pseudomonadales bacterium]
MKLKANTSRIIVALDYADQTAALDMADQLDPGCCRLKVGKELFTREGPRIVEQLIKRDFEVFLDLKYHDIPNTVAKACVAAADLGVWMLNVHASGGKKMMSAAANALSVFGNNKPLLIAVTVLTSMDEQDLTELGIKTSVHDQVLKLAALANESGLDGLVCSAQEALALHQRFPHFSLVTPGIRPKGAALNDQQRIMTPAQAIAAGSNYLVIGRPITAAKEPMQVLAEIQREIEKI